NRVSGRHEEGTHLALAGRGDLPRQERGRQIAEHVGEVSEAGARLSVGRKPRPFADVVQRDRWPAKDGAARAIDVPGDRVQRIQEERHQRAEAAETGTGPAVGGGTLGSCKGTGDLAHVLWVEPRLSSCLLG